MPFDISNPNDWIENTVRGSQLLPDAFVHSLCKSVYWEDGLVRLPREAVLVYDGLCSDRTLIGHVCGTGPDGPDDLIPGDAERIVDRVFSPRLLSRDDPRRATLAAFEAEDGLAEGSTYPNHPAFVAFRFAGGVLPQTTQNEPWVLRHLYDGLHPIENLPTLNCLSVRPQDFVRSGDHYTQTAGMVAVHPIVNHLWRVCPAMVHTLRARAFAKFRYDPDKVLAAQGQQYDDFGFLICKQRL